MGIKAHNPNIENSLIDEVKLKTAANNPNGILSSTGNINEIIKPTIAKLRKILSVFCQMDAFLPMSSITTANIHVLFGMYTNKKAPLISGALKIKDLRY